MLMQISLTGLDQIKTGGDKEGQESKNRARWFNGICIVGRAAASRKINSAIVRGLVSARSPSRDLTWHGSKISREVSTPRNSAQAKLEVCGQY